VNNAPAWEVSEWLNSDTPIAQKDLVGRVVVLGAFQLLCPGCVQQSIPQWRDVHALFASAGVFMLGLHTVFEHHDAMGKATLKAFLHENRITFPVGIDQPQMPGKDLPVTMERYQMRGTPTTLLFDTSGRLRKQTFGHVPDLQLGAEITTLLGDFEGF
jgi:peroxiredoxin